MLRKHFDLLRNSHSTVLMYADECELLVFGAFLNSLSACRKGFFDTLNLVPGNEIFYWYDLYEYLIER